MPSSTCFNILRMRLPNFIQWDGLARGILTDAQGVLFQYCVTFKRGMRLPNQEHIRLLRAADLASAMELSRLAGWNQTEEDWEMMLRLEPLDCFAIEADDRIAATATLLCYGNRLAWIGMVLTRPEYRRRGFAQRLMESTLKRADDLKIQSIKLDATPQGQPLYEKLGFKTEQVVERWFHDGRSSHPRIEPLTSPPQYPSQYSLEMDLKAFGTDRSMLLQNLALRHAPHTITEAYSFSRGGTRARYLGPCVAETQKAVRVVIEHSLRDSPESGWFWDLLSANKNAIQLAEEFGFVPQRRLERMVLGNGPPKNDEMVYAIAGFELG
jgi:GNAT superfamily N-acetyltransferase